MIGAHGIKFVSLLCGVFLANNVLADSATPPTNGLASWYGDEHRGKPMANGQKFDPDQMTAASWFYPLGTRVRVTVASPSAPLRSVVVTITDRGPAKDLVRDGRIIDLARAAFKAIADADLGLISVVLEPVD